MRRPHIPITAHEVSQRLEKKLDLVSHQLKRVETLLMATKQDVKADIDAILVVATETRGLANSALALLKKYFDLVGSAAASAADLDEFRVSLAQIKEQTQGSEDEIKAAIAANSPPVG